MCLSCQPLDGRPRNLGKSFWPLANDKMLLHTPIICHLDCHDRLRNKNFIGHIKLIFFPSPFGGPTALFPEICSFVYLSIVTHQTCSWRRRSWCRLKSWLTLPVPRKRTPCVSSILGWFLFSHFPLSGVIRNGLPSIKMGKLEKFGNNISSTGCKWSSLIAQGTKTHSLLSDSISPFSAPASSFLPSSAIKKWYIMGSWVKRWKIKTKSA